MLGLTTAKFRNGCRWKWKCRKDAGASVKNGDAALAREETLVGSHHILSEWKKIVSRKEGQKRSFDVAGWQSWKKKAHRHSVTGGVRFVAIKKIAWC